MLPRRSQIKLLFSGLFPLTNSGSAHTFRQMHRINSELRKYSCPQILGMFMSPLDKAKGDMDQKILKDCPKKK
jgi:hypothetical protein